jgi:hypothetical protein
MDGKAKSFFWSRLSHKLDGLSLGSRIATSDYLENVPLVGHGQKLKNMGTFSGWLNPRKSTHQTKHYEPMRRKVADSTNFTVNTPLDFFSVIR